MCENGKLSNVIMWAFRFGAVHIHSHIKQGHQSQFKKKIILSETPLGTMVLLNLESIYVCMSDCPACDHKQCHTGMVNVYGLGDAYLVYLPI